jgi:hypothetical protein
MEKTVKKHKDAIKKLRLKLKGLAEVMPKLREEILTLKFDAEGKRRPDTGPQRYLMRLGYKERVRPNIRTALVACGLLRGIPYKRIEPKADPYTYSTANLRASVLAEIHEALGEDAALRAEWTKERVKAIILDGVAPIALEAA